MARKKKTKKTEYEYLDQYLRVRLTKDEKRQLEKTAAELGVTVSYLVRRRLFSTNRKW